MLRAALLQGPERAERREAPAEQRERRLRSREQRVESREWRAWKRQHSRHTIGYGEQP